MHTLQTVEARCGNARVVIACDESAVADAKTLLTSLVVKAIAPRDGLVLPLGWSQLVLRSEGDAFIAHEPNYASNPIIALRRECTTTLAVHREMVAFANARGVEPDFVRFSDRLGVQKGWAHAPSLVLTRDASGWRIDVPGSREEHAALRVYELLGARPALLRAFALPPGTTLRVEGNDLSSS